MIIDPPPPFRALPADPAAHIPPMLHSIDLDALTDDAALDILRTMHTNALAACTDDATYLLDDNFSDDDSDYFRANALAFAAITSAFIDAQYDDTPTNALRYLLHDEFLCDLFTATFDYPFDIDYADD